MGNRFQFHINLTGQTHDNENTTDTTIQNNKLTDVGKYTGTKKTYETIKTGSPEINEENEKTRYESERAHKITKTERQTPRGKKKKPTRDNDNKENGSPANKTHP
jgi:hypothetical protein